MVKKTFKEKGLPYVSELALENSRALKALVQWNHEHGIRFFRSHPSQCAPVGKLLTGSAMCVFGGPECSLYTVLWQDGHLASC